MEEPIDPTTGTWAGDAEELLAMGARDIGAATVRGMLDELREAKNDRDHADKCLRQMASLADSHRKEIERLTAEAEKRAAYTKDLENDYSRRWLASCAELEKLRASLATWNAIVVVGRKMGWHAKDHLALYEQEQATQRLLDSK